MLPAKLRLLLMFVLIAWAPAALATDLLSIEAVQQLGSEQPSVVQTAIDRLSRAESSSAVFILTAYLDGRLGYDDAQVPWITMPDGRRLRVESRLAGDPQGTLRFATPDNLTRRRSMQVLIQLRLRSADATQRRTAAAEVASHPEEVDPELLRELQRQERDPATQQKLAVALAKLDIQSADPSLRIRAAKTIERASDISMREVLEAMLQQGPAQGPREPDPEVRKAIRAAVAAISWQELKIRTFANLIYGLSLGSVLLLAALGLAITFGLMKVINMAHGEMLMLGAYATYMTQVTFQRLAPSHLGWYLLVAVPTAFVVTAAVGLLLERLVVRRLYGRPLETLLATWGLSLILIQAVRNLFGAQNVTVATPEWLSGGWELMPTVVVPYSRVLVLGFTCIVVSFVWYVLQRTNLGLKLRAVTQNRDMAAALGIPTRRIDAWTFALGSGVAGLGGVALSQLGNVGPELGQQHIIDSFMVVVLGGVGNVLGSVVGAFGLGLVSKYLEPNFGAVLGKIAILVVIILFIQWRPQGLFALKGRALEG